MIDVAYAMAEGAGSGQGGASPYASLIMMISIFAIFYLLLFRPQQKKAKEHKQMLENLRKGDAIITQGGIHGKIVAIADNNLTVEIADKVRVKVSRGYIAGLASDPENASPTTT
jgi:preprotein translocase subunit YajC